MVKQAAQMIGEEMATNTRSGPEEMYWEVLFVVRVAVKRSVVDYIYVYAFVYKYFIYAACI